MKAVEHGANIDWNGVPDKRSPLMAAVIAGHAKVAAFLLSQGADWGLGDNGEYTPLHAAAYHGHTEIVRLLLDAELDAREYHKDGYTPFHRACEGDSDAHTQTVRLFLEHGVEPDLPTQDGGNRTCLMLAQYPPITRVIRRWKAMPRLAPKSDEDEDL